MNSAPEVVFSYFFFIVITLKMITAQDNCTPIQCSSTGPEIVYPFGVKDRQGEGCGYPGFNLTCNTYDKTVLKLPESGEFLVRKIDYAKKEIRLYDQDNCLARRFQGQNLNADLSPFKGFAYQSYNFFNCPPFITSNRSAIESRERILPIPCLSSQTNTVLATVTSTGNFVSNVSQALMNRGCEISAPITIPIPFSAVTNIYSYVFTVDDLFLTWVDPEKPTYHHEKGKEKPNWKKIIIITVSVFSCVAVVVLIIVFSVCGRKKGKSAVEIFLAILGAISSCLGIYGTGGKGLQGKSHG
ncbi:hypothetical protein MKX01_027947 [Papaver californicum]|nr:hypothetical protein MKX01_027947 [Papaver californicum]